MKFSPKMIVPVAALVIAAGLGGFLIANTAKLSGGPAVRTKIIGTTSTVAGASIGGPFTLTNHRGEVVTERDYLGKHTLIFFGFTHCPDICPTTMNEIAFALDQLGGKAKDVNAVFVTIDPERDNPEALGDYMELFDKRITGLTGTPEQIAGVAKAFRIFYTKNISAEEQAKPKEDRFYLMDHSSITYLMSPTGEFIRHYSYGTPAKALADDIRARL